MRETGMPLRRGVGGSLEITALHTSNPLVENGNRVEPLPCYAGHDPDVAHPED